MNSRVPALAAGIGILLLLAGCAATPAVDLDEARDWLETVQAEESDGPGAAGTASMQIPGASAGDDPAATGFQFDSPTQLKRADARCFGDATAHLTVTLTSADGESEVFTAEIPCDQEPHGLDLDADPTSAALVEAVGSSPTYLHVTVIQELIAEH